MINNLSLKLGSTEAKPNLKINLTPITVFVGPNNSGKSRVLIEIENYCKNSAPQLSQVVLDKLQFMPWEKDEFESELNKIELTPSLNDNMPVGQIKIGKVNPLSSDPITICIFCIIAFGFSRKGQGACFLVSCPLALPRLSLGCCNF